MPCSTPSPTLRRRSSECCRASSEKEGSRRASSEGPPVAKAARISPIRSSSNDDDNGDDAASLCLRAQGVLMGRFHPRSRLPGVEKQEAELFERLQLASTGQSTSIILTGRRGSGKHVTLDRVLSRLEKDKGGYQVVRLSGQIHAEASAGVNELARQLLTDEGAARKRNFQDNADVLQEEMRRYLRGSRSASLRNRSRPLLVVLSDLTGFALGDTRQTILYLLLDAIHNTEVSLVVLGITTDHNVLELFEKRVRSRLHNNLIHFPHATTPSNILIMLDHRFLLRSSSTPKDDDDSEEEEESESPGWPRFVEAHNASWRSLRSSAEFLETIDDGVLCGRPMRWYARLALSVASGLLPSGPPLLKAWREACDAHTPMNLLSCRRRVASLPPPQLVLLICYLRFEYNEIAPYNLELAMASLARLRQTNANAVPDEDTLLRAHAALLASGLIFVPTHRVFVDEDALFAGSLTTANNNVTDSSGPIGHRFNQVRLDAHLGVDELWMALREDHLGCQSTFRQWALQGAI